MGVHCCGCERQERRDDEAKERRQEAGRKAQIGALEQDGYEMARAVEEYNIEV
jgi:hypothetical protein